MPSAVLKWDVDLIAQALQITPDDVRGYFTDGRRVSFIVERRVAKEVINGELAKSEGAGYDLIDPDGGKWEVRSISSKGIYFCPSYMVGSGRHFEENGFLEKLEEIEGYIIADIEAFPSIPVWIIPFTQIEKWWYKGQLGTTSKISRKRALDLLKELE